MAVHLLKLLTVVEPESPLRQQLAALVKMVLPQLIGDGALSDTPPTRPPDDQGWVTLDLAFRTFREARTSILGLGGAVEVLQPEPLRESVRDFASRIVDLYDGAREDDGGERETRGR